MISTDYATRERLVYSVAECTDMVSRERSGGIICKIFCIVQETEFCHVNDLAMAIYNYSKDLEDDTGTYSHMRIILESFLSVFTYVLDRDVTLDNIGKHNIDLINKFWNVIELHQQMRINFRYPSDISDDCIEKLLRISIVAIAGAELEGGVYTACQFFKGIIVAYPTFQRNVMCFIIKLYPKYQTSYDGLLNISNIMYLHEIGGLSMATIKDNPISYDIAAICRPKVQIELLLTRIGDADRASDLGWFYHQAPQRIAVNIAQMI